MPGKMGGFGYDDAQVRRAPHAANSADPPLRPDPIPRARFPRQPPAPARASVAHPLRVRPPHILQIADEARELDKSLRSTNTGEKLNGMKKLLGMMSAGRDVSNFFASVVMNIAQDSFEVKVLVYLYLCLLYTSPSPRD